MKVAEIELTVFIETVVVDGKKVRQIVSAREAKGTDAEKVTKILKYNRPEKLSEFVTMSGYSDERATGCLADQRLYHGLQSEMRKDILKGDVKSVYELSFPTGERGQTKVKAAKVVTDYYFDLAVKKLSSLPPEGRKAHEKAILERNADVEAPEECEQLAAYFLGLEIKAKAESMEI